MEPLRPWQKKKLVRNLISPAHKGDYGYDGIPGPGNIYLIRTALPSIHTQLFYGAVVCPLSFACSCWSTLEGCWSGNTRTVLGSEGLL